MRRILVLVFVMIVISACVDSHRTTPVFHMPTLSTSTTPTPVPESLILADFPLTIGTTWKYTGEISDQSPAEGSPLEKWSGFITVEVVDKSINSNGNTVFTLRQELEPAPSQKIWREPDTYNYTISGDGIFRESAKIYQFPVLENASWYLSSDFSYLRWYAKYIGNVEVPYGKFDGCYVFFLETNTETAYETFCPGIGFVKHEYVRHGISRTEEFVLIAYESIQ